MNAQSNESNSQTGNCGIWGSLPVIGTSTGNVKIRLCLSWQTTISHFKTATKKPFLTKYLVSSNTEDIKIQACKYCQIYETQSTILYCLTSRILRRPFMTPIPRSNSELYEHCNNQRFSFLNSSKDCHRAKKVCIRCHAMATESFLESYPSATDLFFTSLMARQGTAGTTRNYQLKTTLLTAASLAYCKTPYFHFQQTNQLRLS